MNPSQPLPCPHLPEAPTLLKASSMKRFAKTDRGPEFYEAALQCAQSLWQQVLPAQAILQLNRAFGADLTENDSKWPLPYAAMAWIMAHREEDQFIGNPRRHFQHLATRMVEPRKELRSWRAWACWYLAYGIFPDYPADEKQIAEEGIVEPSKDTIFAKLSVFGLSSEADLWLSVANS